VQAQCSAEYCAEFHGITEEAMIWPASVHELQHSVSHDTKTGSSLTLYDCPTSFCKPSYRPNQPVASNGGFAVSASRRHSRCPESLTNTRKPGESCTLPGNDDVRRGHAVCREDMFGFFFLAAVLHQAEEPPARE
jgi:hypothetical protein